MFRGKGFCKAGGLRSRRGGWSNGTREEWKKKALDRLKMPKPNNVFYIRYALQLGATIDDVYRVTKIDPWFLHNLKQIVDFEEELYAYTVQPA